MRSFFGDGVFIPGNANTAITSTSAVLAGSSTTTAADAMDPMMLPDTSSTPQLLTTLLQVPGAGSVYQMHPVKTVSALWMEWKEGLAGGPSMESLEQNDKGWRASPAAKTAFCRRKRIQDKIQSLIDSGMIEADAVSVLEAQRGQGSLNRLSDMIMAERKAAGSE